MILINKDIVEEKSWDDFRSTGLLWWVNRILDLFGWVIIIEYDIKTGALNKVYPALRNVRGFSEKCEERGFSQLSKYITTHPERLDGKWQPQPEFELNDHYERLSKRFLSLPHCNQHAIVARLDLFTAQEIWERQGRGRVYDLSKIMNPETFAELFKRAHEKGLLAELWEEVEKCRFDPLRFNPYKEEDK